MAAPSSSSQQSTTKATDSGGGGGGGGCSLFVHPLPSGSDEINVEQDESQPFISNHQWFVGNVPKLTRRNKISSRSFEVPRPPPLKKSTSGSRSGSRSTTPRAGGASSSSQPGTPLPPFQFRLALLRGVEKAEKEEDDPIGVFLEYQKPTSEEGSPSSSLPHPGNCKVICKVMPFAPPASKKEEEEDNASSCSSPKALTQSADTTFNLEHTTIGFRAIIPASILTNEHYCREGGAMILQISLEMSRNGSSASSSIARATETVTSSFFQGAASAFSWVSKSAETLKQKVSETVSSLSQEATTTMTERQDDDDIGVEGAAASATATQQESTEEHHQRTRSNPPENPPPWQAVPSKWQGPREKRWRYLCTQLLPANEMTFLAGSERHFSSEERLILTQSGLTPAALLAATSQFDFDSDVHQGLLDGQLTLRRTRYELVPLKISEEKFWANYFWKVRCLETCATDEQAQILISVLNAPYSLLEDDSAAAVGSSSSPLGRGVSHGATPSSPELPNGGSASASPAAATGLDVKDVAAVLSTAKDASALLLELLDEDGMTIETADDIYHAALSSVKGSLSNIESILEKDDKRSKRKTPSPVKRLSQDVRASLMMAKDLCVNLIERATSTTAASSSPAQSQKKSTTPNGDESATSQKEQPVVPTESNEEKKNEEDVIAPAEERHVDPAVAVTTKTTAIDPASHPDDEDPSTTQEDPDDDVQDEDPSLPVQEDDEKEKDDEEATKESEPSSDDKRENVEQPKSNNEHHQQSQEELANHHLSASGSPPHAGDKASNKSSAGSPFPWEDEEEGDGDVDSPPAHPSTKDDEDTIVVSQNDARTPSPTAANKAKDDVVGASTGKKTANSDSGFALMPWEEEDE